MCGIAGIISFDGSRVLHQRVKSMTDALVHRGPDGEGIYIDPNGGVVLGHRRLSIIDLSEAGKQPFRSRDGRYILNYNGEIYNYVELRQKLESLGEQFLSATDTEVLLKLFIHYRENCLEFLDGMFAFAIWDSQKQELFCARDRFGEKPFFYFKDDREMVFASEIKAIWSAGIPKKVDHRKMHDYLLYGTVRDANDLSTTFYGNIRELAAAHYMLISADGCEKTEKYWDVDISQENHDITFADASANFAELLENSVKKRLRSDVSIGSSLSGGLDSSSIVCLINKIKPKEQRQRTFSARFNNFDRDEGKYIAEVLNNLPKLDAHEIYPSKDSALENFHSIVYHQDEPFNSLSISAQFEVMQLVAKSGTKVLLDGQGADEYLAGYRSFHEMFLTELKYRDKILYEREYRAFEKMHGAIDLKHWKSYIMQRNHSLFKNIAQLRKKITSPDSPYFVGINPDLVKQFKKHQNPISKPNSFKGHLKFALQGRGLGDLLRYADRNSMAHSVEVRLPFLDHKLVEFVLSLPMEYLIHDAWTKYLLRKSMEGILPEIICWRKDKIGFEPPQKQWMNSKDFRELLEESKSKLLREKIIVKTYPKLDWHYIMLAAYL